MAVVTILVALLLVEGAVESFWRGSPIRWWILVGVGCWAFAMVPAILFFKWGARLWVTTAAAAGLIVLTVWRLGSRADPGLVILTVPFPQLLPTMAALALFLFAALVMRFRIVRRQPLIMAIVALLTIYCLLPFAFAIVYATPIEALVRGAGFWTAPPLWMQGGYLALQGLMPLGFVLAILAWLGALAGRSPRGSPVFPAVCWLVFGATFVVGSIALAAAGIPNLASRYASDWLPAFGRTTGSTTAPPASTPAAPQGAETTQGAPALSGPGNQAPGRRAVTKVLELTADGVEFTPFVGDRTAPLGQTFVVIRTTWKNVTALPAGAAGGAPTPYNVPSLPRRLWLLADSRYAEPMDETATQALAGHLPVGTLTLPDNGEAVTGSVVFRAPASVAYLALVLIDSVAGNAVVAVKGRPADAPPAPTLGPARSNEALTLVATEAGWSDGAPAPPPGLRYYTLGLRGSGLAKDDLTTVDLAACAYLQTDQGFVAESEQADWLKRPLGRTAAFLPGYPNEGQLAFLIPADSVNVQFLLRPRSGGAIDLPVSEAFVPAWPQPVGAIADGSTLRVLRLPPPSLPQVLPGPRSGFRFLAVDVLVQNLKTVQDIEFQMSRQLRVLDANGHSYSAAPESRVLVFRPTGRAVIPAGSSRRFQQLYLVPVDQPLRLEYRGFERTEVVDLATPPPR